MTVASLSVHRVDIYRNIGVPDGRGGVPDNWAPDEIRVPCRIVPLSAKELAGLWKGEPTKLTHRIYFPDTSIDLNEGEQIRYGTRIFNVQGVRNVDELDRFLTVEVEEVR